MKPGEERERIQILQNISGYLFQRNITTKNIAYLKKLCKFPDKKVQRQAGLF